MAWHQTVILKLRASGLFQEVRVVGAKVRASISAASFVDIHRFRITFNGATLMAVGRLNFLQCEGKWVWRLML